MDGMPHNRPLNIVASLALACVAGVVGCARDHDSSLWPFGNQKKPDNMGIMAPSEEVKSLQRMSKEAPTLSQDERVRRSKLLVAAIQKENDPVLRAEIVRTLAVYRTDAGAAVVKAACKDPDVDVRITVCQVLGRQGDATAVSLLNDLVTSDLSTDVRLAAARALGQTHDASAVPALGGLLQDADPAIQYRAVQSLQAVTGKNFGNDVARWQAYVKGETPKPREPTSIAERFRQMF